jgi:NRPS condensation-like uncharacterized protein
MESKWVRLDNAAKIFPSSASKSNTLVFRFSCELTEPVDPIMLQDALDRTTAEFNVFQYVLRRGLFWYYLEATDLRPVVREEYKSPCSPLYEPGRRSLLYEVTYYRSTINFEIYHALTDGTGALHFMELLVTKYLSAVHEIPEPPTYYDASQAQRDDDSFRRFSSKGRGKRKKLVRAFLIRGSRYSEDRLSVIRGNMPLSAALDVSRSYGCTLTSLLGAALMNAVGATVPVRSMHKPVVIAVPVNLRKYFPSVSARNFFSIVHVGRNIDPVRLTPLDELAAWFGKELAAQLTPENMSADINAYAGAERNPLARIAPLPLKNFVLRRAYMHAQNYATVTLSNVGAVRLPPEVEHYVRSFSVCNATNKLQACVCSYRDVLSVSFSTPYVSSDIPRMFFRTLTGLGIDVEISANRLD